MRNLTVKMDVVSVLTIMFVVLKLAGLISWSWWWVLSPLWIGFALAMIVLLIVILTLSRY